MEHIPEEIIREWIEKAKPLVDSAFNLGWDKAVEQSIDVLQDMITRIKSEPASNEAVQNVMLLDAAIILLVNLKKK